MCEMFDVYFDDIQFNILSGFDINISNLNINSDNIGENYLRMILNYFFEKKDEENFL